MRSPYNQSVLPELQIPILASSYQINRKLYIAQVPNSKMATMTALSLTSLASIIPSKESTFFH